MRWNKVKKHDKYNKRGWSMRSGRVDEWLCHVPSTEKPTNASFDPLIVSRDVYYSSTLGQAENRQWKAARKFE
jgi:hypothetical protein